MSDADEQLETVELYCAGCLCAAAGVDRGSLSRGLYPAMTVACRTEVPASLMPQVAGTREHPPVPHAGDYQHCGYWWGRVGETWLVVEVLGDVVVSGGVFLGVDSVGQWGPFIGWVDRELPKERGSQCVINALLDDDGSIIKSPESFEKSTAEADPTPPDSLEGGDDDGTTLETPDGEDS